ARAWLRMSGVDHRVLTTRVDDRLHVGLIRRTGPKNRSQLRGQLTRDATDSNAIVLQSTTQFGIDYLLIGGAPHRLVQRGIILRSSENNNRERAAFWFNQSSSRADRCGLTQIWLRQITTDQDHAGCKPYAEAAWPQLFHGAESFPQRHRAKSDVSAGFRVRVN